MRAQSMQAMDAAEPVVRDAAQALLQQAKAQDAAVAQAASTAVAYIGPAARAVAEMVKSGSAVVNEALGGALKSAIDALPDARVGNMQALLATGVNVGMVVVSKQQEGAGWWEGVLTVLLLPCTPPSV